MTPRSESHDYEQFIGLHPEPYTDPDDAHDREQQARVDNRLTDEERRIACGCLSTFILQMGHDLRKGGLTAEGEIKYRQDIRTAGEAVSKLMAGA